MIGMLHGQVDFIDAASAIIEVGGVGYETRMPSADLASMHAGQTVKVYTSLNVSQDAITLYGFSSLASKRMFLQLQKVSGIGPKVALSLLSTLPPERLAKAVADGDATALAKAPGLRLFSNSRGPSISVRSRGLPKRFVLRKMPVRNRSWKV